MVPRGTTPGRSEARDDLGDVLEVAFVVKGRRIVADRLRGDDRLDCADAPQEAAIPQAILQLEDVGAAGCLRQSGNAVSSCVTRVWSAPARALNPALATTGGQTMIEAGLCKLTRSTNAARTC